MYVPEMDRIPEMVWYLRQRVSKYIADTRLAGREATDLYGYHYLNPESPHSAFEEFIQGLGRAGLPSAEVEPVDELADTDAVEQVTSE